MLPTTTVLNDLFWMFLGVLQVLVIAGTCAWVGRYGKTAKWWQVFLLYGGFTAVCLAIVANTACAGEFENVAGMYCIGFFGILVILAASRLIRLFADKTRAA